LHNPLPIISFGGVSSVIRVTLLYNQPNDPVEFERYHWDEHMQFGPKIPLVRRWEAGRVLPDPSGQTPPFFYVGAVYYKSLEEMAASLSSPEGRMAMGDIPNYATGGLQRVISEVKGLPGVKLGY
jgi:uncharacterized protein (TIGR02118 family)